MASEDGFYARMFQRHAHPFSVWSRLLSTPLLLVPLRTRRWWLYGPIGAWLAVNPVITPPIHDTSCLHPGHSGRGVPLTIRRASREASTRQSGTPNGWPTPERSPPSAPSATATTVRMEAVGWWADPCLRLTALRGLGVLVLAVDLSPTSRLFTGAGRAGSDLIGA